MVDPNAVIRGLAASFAANVIEALRHTPLEEITSLGGGGARAAHRTARRSASAGGGHKTAQAVAALLGKHKEGLRADQLRAELGVARPVLLRALAEGLASGTLKKHGQKRGTVYSVHGASHPVKPKPAHRKAAKKTAKKAKPHRKTKKASKKRR